MERYKVIKWEGIAENRTLLTSHFLHSPLFHGNEKTLDFIVKKADIID